MGKCKSCGHEKEESYPKEIFSTDLYRIIQLKKGYVCLGDKKKIYRLEMQIGQDAMGGVNWVEVEEIDSWRLQNFIQEMKEMCRNV